MAVFSFTNPTVWVDLADMSNDSNEVNINATAAQLDSTNFATSGWQTSIGGLRSATLDLKGFFDAGTADLPDNLLFGEIGTSGVPVTVAPQGATVGNIAYFATFMQPTYKPGGKVGDILSFDTSKVSDAPLVRGQVANVTAKTATGTTTGLNLGAPTANQRVWAALHVITVTGTTPSMTVTLQGDTGSGFPAPSTIATSSAFTSASSQLIKGAVGVTADTWYRLSLTITGTTPSFLLYAAIGVG
jgi:hypothetical protein